MCVCVCVCVCVCPPHLWMFITSLKRETEEGRRKLRWRAKEELTRMIVFFQSTMSVSATRGTMFDSSREKPKATIKGVKQEQERKTKRGTRWHQAAEIKIWVQLRTEKLRHESGLASSSCLLKRPHTSLRPSPPSQCQGKIKWIIY